MTEEENGKEKGKVKRTKTRKSWKKKTGRRDAIKERPADKKELKEEENKKEKGAV